MDTTKVDPAAALIAVFAVAFTAMNEDGAWEPVNVVMSLVVLALLWAFLWPESRPRLRPAVGAVLTVGVVLGMGLAYPAQQWLIRMTGRQPRQNIRGVVYEHGDIVEWAWAVGTSAGMVLAALVLGMLFRRLPAPTEPTPRSVAHERRPGHRLLRVLVVLVAVRDSWRSRRAR